MFSHISAQNLFSWEELDYEIKPGISQITGFNYDDHSSEGCGKSSVPNILCWTLYGKIPKEVRIDEVIRQGSKAGKGEVLLGSGHRVGRSRKPNDVYIIDTEGNYIRGKDAKDTQDLINQLIGLDFDAFCQTIYFAQGYPKRFISAPETEKVSILSQVLDLSIFDKAKANSTTRLKTVEGKLSERLRNLDRVDSELQKLKSNAALLVSFIEKFEEGREETRFTLLARAEELQEFLRKESSLKAKTSEIKTSQNRSLEILNELNQNLIELETQEKSKGALRLLRANLESSIEKSNSRIQSLEKKLDQYQGVNCPTCGTKISEHQKYQIIKEVRDLDRELEEAKKSRDSLKNQLEKQLHLEPGNPEKITTCKARIQQERENEKNLRESSRQYEILFLKLESAKEELKGIQETLKKVTSATCSQELEKLAALDQNIIVTEETKRSLELDIQDLRKLSSNLEILRTGFKEVKQFVFQALLNELSVKSTRFVQSLFEVPVSIKFSNEDEDGGVTKILTDITIDGSPRSLGLVSGGQRGRISLGVDLALASIIADRKTQPLKFRILDEPFKDLSEGSSAKVLELLQELSGPTIVIEHNSLIKSIIHNVFEIEYRNGVSRASEGLEM